MSHRTISHTDRRHVFCFQFDEQGARIDAVDECVALVAEAHRKLMPGVPLVGWDVALTSEEGIVLLEANLSCNFFCASFDEDQYCALVERTLNAVEAS